MLFDCDGTLVDSEPISAAVTAELLTARGVPLATEDVLARFTGLSAATTKAIVEERFGVRLGEDFDRDKRRRLDAAFDARLRTVPGMPELVGSLAATGRRICVASSSTPHRIDRSLAVTGLDRHFPPEVRFSATMVRRGKPAPDLFQLAAARLGVDPAACVVVEDSPFGVEAGVAAGMTVVGFTAAGHASPDLAPRLRAAGAHEVAPDAEALRRLLGAPAGSRGGSGSGSRSGARGGSEPRPSFPSPAGTAPP